MRIKNSIQNLKLTLPEHVTLVAVSKTKPIEDILEAYETGHLVFGENKIQEMVEKYEQLPKDIQWHMIGHVQRNKVKYIASFVSLIHGVDNFKLLKEINKQAEKNERVIDCLLQIKIADEDSKFGMAKDDAEQILITIGKILTLLEKQFSFYMTVVTRSVPFNICIVKHLALKIEGMNININIKITFLQTIS